MLCWYNFSLFPDLILGWEALPARRDSFWEDRSCVQEKSEDQQRHSECLGPHGRKFLLQNSSQGGEGRKDQNSSFWLQRRLSEGSHHRARGGCWGGKKVLGFLLRSPKWSEKYFQRRAWLYGLQDLRPRGPLWLRQGGDHGVHGEPLQEPQHGAGHSS